MILHGTTYKVYIFNQNRSHGHPIINNGPRQRKCLPVGSTRHMSRWIDFTDFGRTTVAEKRARGRLLTLVAIFPAGNIRRDRCVHDRHRQDHQPHEKGLFGQRVVSTRVGSLSPAGSTRSNRSSCLEPDDCKPHVDGTRWVPNNDNNLLVASVLKGNSNFPSNVKLVLK